MSERRPWFAWHPVLVDDRLIWLCTIERRVDTAVGVGGIFAFPAYRLPAPSPVAKDQRKR